MGWGGGGEDTQYCFETERGFGFASTYLLVMYALKADYYCNPLVMTYSCINVTFIHFALVF